MSVTKKEQLILDKVVPEDICRFHFHYFKLTVNQSFSIKIIFHFPDTENALFYPQQVFDNLDFSIDYAYFGS